jgi:hypothetical protein
MEGTEYSIDSGSYVAPSGGVAERAADASDSSWQAIVDSGKIQANDKIVLDYRAQANKLS